VSDKGHDAEETPMIRLTRINESPFFLNCDLMEFIEVTPDTVITMMNGGKVLVRERAEEVVEKIVEYRRRIRRRGAGDLIRRVRGV